MIRILSLEEQPLCTLPYQYSGKQERLCRGEYAVYRAWVEGLPAGLDALFVTADLQGVEIHEQGAGRLLGEWLCERLAAWCGSGEWPAASRLGIVLAGDLYSGRTARDRGRSGDVTAVWQGFARSFRWVAGVAGNHDRFQAPLAEVFRAEPGMFLLDGRVVRPDGLAIAGIGGVVGNPRKLLRRSEAEFVALIARLTARPVDLLVLHEGPGFPEHDLRGSPAIAAALQRCADMLVTFGHCHWRRPLLRFGRGMQALNVDGRGVLLMEQRGPRAPAH